MTVFLNNDVVKVENGAATTDGNKENDYRLEIFQSSLNFLSHLLVGVTVGVSLCFGFRAVPLNTTQLHIVLCVIGYHLLMAEAIMSMSGSNGWSSKFRLMDKRRAHWVMMITGSVLALTGSFIMIQNKNVNWNTLHGQFALVAMVFTSVSLVNGLASLYSYELKRYLNVNLSKITHICFGTVAFAASTIALCYGFDKNSFRNWATSTFADVIIAFTVTFTVLIIISPLLNFYRKTKVVIKNVNM